MARPLIGLVAIAEAIGSDLANAEARAAVQPFGSSPSPSPVWPR
jgi:hypothetical protein